MLDHQKKIVDVSCPEITEADQSGAGRAQRSCAGSSRVLLLQGPVGPFFARLQETLEGNGFEVRRVCFHAGDRVFAPRNNRILFNGGADAWRDWIRSFLAATQIDCIILFGAERPIHQIAREVAQRLGIRVIALEEGYLRPGFVTIEEGGNNAASPIAGCLPPADFTPEDVAGVPVTNYRSLRVMGWYSAVHYVLRTFSQTSQRRQLFHRRFSAFPEVLRWARNGWRRVLHANRNLATIQNLLEHHDGAYFLVPLQVSADANLQAAAAGWCSVRLIREALSSFAKHADPQARLVFKIHPLERGHVTHVPLINATAATLGVADRVDVVDTGSLGLLARHSAGMITINSTSGLSAIHHGTSLLVIGRAIYANPQLAICANGAPDFDAFWATHHVAAPSVRRNYLEWLRQAALAPGDFYAAEGITLACEAVLARLGPGMDTLTTHEPRTPSEAVCANKVLMPAGAPLVA